MAEHQKFARSPIEELWLEVPRCTSCVETLMILNPIAISILAAFKAICSKGRSILYHFLIRNFDWPDSGFPSWVSRQKFFSSQFHWPILPRLWTRYCPPPNPDHDFHTIKRIGELEISLGFGLPSLYAVKTSFLDAQHLKSNRTGQRMKGELPVNHNYKLFEYLYGRRTDLPTTRFESNVLTKVSEGFDSDGLS